MGSRSAIGVNISSTCVRAAELSTAHGRVRLDRFGQVPLPHGAVLDGEVIDGKAVSVALRSLWKSGGFKSKSVILGVGNQRVMVRQVDLPVMESDDRRGSLRYQVADMVPMPLDEAVLDFVPVEAVDKGGEPMERGLLVAASEDLILGSIQAAEEAGLEVEQVDINSFAVLRSAAHSGRVGTAPDTEAVVDIGARLCIIVVHEGGVPRFVRHLMLGSESINDALVTKAGLTPEQANAVKLMPGAWSGTDPEQVQRVLGQAVTALVDEIRSSVDFYLASGDGRRLSRLVLTGGGAQLPGLAERLSGTVHAPVVRGAPFASLDTAKCGLSPDQLQFVECMAAVPVGLAMGGLR